MSGPPCGMPRPTTPEQVGTPCHRNDLPEKLDLSHAVSFGHGRSARAKMATDQWPQSSSYDRKTDGVRIGIAKDRNIHPIEHIR